MQNADLLTQLSIVIAIGSAIAFLMRLLKQPLIIGHIITGILVGPIALNLIRDERAFAFLGSFGVVLLLFIVGLELSLKIITRLGKVVAITTIIQVSVVTFAGAGLARLLHFGRLESFIIGICLAMSSTIIIVTLLQQQKEIKRLFAQITVGILILQDLVATSGKIAVSAKSSGGSGYEIIF